jgi:hypothetical protein
MMPAQLVVVLSAVLGIAGTVILFFGTYGLEPLEGGVFGSPEVQEWNERVKAKNAARVIRQRVGLGLICFSFVFQGAAVFLP